MTMPESPQVNVHIAGGAAEVIRLVATLMLFGGAGAIGWAVAHTGYAELAGSGLSVMLVTSAKLMWHRGMITVPSSGNADGFAETRNAMQRITAEWGTWSARASMPAIVAISIAYALAFLALRAGVIQALTVFRNPWIAGGASAIAGAFVVMPRLIPGMIAAFKSKGAPTPVIPMPAPTMPTQPMSPVTTPVPSPAPAPIVVRRRTSNQGEKHA